MIPTIGKNNVGVKMTFTIRDSAGKPVNLFGTTVTMTLAPNTAQKAYKQSNLLCTIEDAVNGVVSYLTKEGDFTQGGYMYSTQHTVTFPNGNKYTSSLTKIACLDNL
jgi:hypothetical protein